MQNAEAIPNTAATAGVGSRMRRGMRGRGAIILSLFFLSCIAAGGAAAQSTKFYSYDTINVDVAVQKNTSLVVSERQTFHYVGHFNQAVRTIPLKGISTVVDVRVRDGATGLPLGYSSKKLDKTNPSSWGKYTYGVRGGVMEIEWYYDLADTVKPWIIEYRVIGAISFGSQFDRLYWNVFSSYDAPVDRVDVTISLPQPADVKGIRQYAYRTFAPIPVSQAYEQSGVFRFSGAQFQPREAFTVDVSWPRGLIDRSGFWRDFFWIYYGYLLSFAALVAAFGIGFFYWLCTERLRKGRGAITPQYEPPLQLRPATAEVITKERVTPRGWSATVVDLAVRGYLMIREEPPTFLDRIAAFFLPLVGWGVLIFFTVFFIGFKARGEVSDPGVLYILFWFVLIVVIVIPFIRTTVRGQSRFRTILAPRHYVLTQKKESDDQLEDYERRFLKILFSRGNEFSTKYVKDHPRFAKEIHERMKTLMQALYRETERDTDAYEKSLIDEKWEKRIFGWIITAAMAFFFVGIFFQVPISGTWVLVFTIASCIAGLFAFMRFEARLSREGRILKEDWLGFKMYLERAERLRLQNLTPEAFEVFLPYAIVFGVEKQWAKAFDAIGMQPPRWYSGGSFASSSIGSGPSGGFSASAFSASFASSFVGAFSSSGAGGGGGAAGGGGAGGGGGGGGGGAS